MSLTYYKPTASQTQSQRSQTGTNWGKWVKCKTIGSDGVCGAMEDMPWPEIVG